MLELLASRLSRAYTTWPTGAQWGMTVLALCLLALVALALLRGSGDLTQRPLERAWPHKLLLVAAAFLSPALFEETLYRVLLNPHPLEAAPWTTRLTWGALSNALYVAAHPLVAWVWPWARRYFWRPAVLAVVALLGLACTLLYAVSGSVWPPVVLHGVVVGVWKLHFGGPARVFAGLVR